MKQQDKRQDKLTDKESTVRPQTTPKPDQNRKQDELSIEDLAKVAGGVRRKKFGRH